MSGSYQPTADVLALEREIRTKSLEAQEWLARRLSARSPLWKARLRDRDRLLLDLASEHMLAGSIAAVSEALHQVLKNYASSTWLRDREHSEPPYGRHATAHKIMKLNHGRVPSARSLQRLAWTPNSPGEMAKATAEDRRHGTQSDDHREARHGRRGRA